MQLGEFLIGGAAIAIVVGCRALSRRYLAKFASKDDDDIPP